MEGGPGIRWQWLKAGGTGEIRIKSPRKQKAGIRQEESVGVAVGGNQRWRLRAVLRADAAGRRATLWARFADSSGHSVGAVAFGHRLSAQKKEYSDLLVTPPGAETALVEVNMREKGTLHIYKVAFERLYPLSELSVEIHHVPHDCHRVPENCWDGDKPCPIAVEVVGNRFEEYQEVLTTCDDWYQGIMQDASEKRAQSVAVLNQGANPATIKLCSSPDGMHWTTDCGEYVLPPGEMRVLVANCFLRYYALGYRSTEPSHPTCLYVWYSTQA